jgi:hypothetical protein
MSVLRRSATQSPGFLEAPFIEQDVKTMPNTFILYHGTTHDFTEINVSRGKPYKDFGRGFYLTAERYHAANLAERNRRIEENRRAATGDICKLPIFVYTYEIDVYEMEKLNVRQFDAADREWIKFITANRTNRQSVHDYDIVIGPTANDQTNSVIQIYFSGGYGEVGSDDALDILIKMIIPDKLPSQYFFKTQRAANLLRRTGEERL